MDYEIGEEFKLAGENDKKITLSADMTNDIIIVFRFKSWFDFSSKETNSDKVDFSQITGDSINLSEDGDEVTKKIREVIKENIKNSAEYGKDDNSDGILEENEDTNKDEEDEEDENAEDEEDIEDTEDTEDTEDEEEA